MQVVGHLPGLTTPAEGRRARSAVASAACKDVLLSFTARPLILIDEYNPRRFRRRFTPRPEPTPRGLIRTGFLSISGHNHRGQSGCSLTHDFIACRHGCLQRQKRRRWWPAGTQCLNRAPWAVRHPYDTSNAALTLPPQVIRESNHDPIQNPPDRREGIAWRRGMIWTSSGRAKGPLSGTAHETRPAPHPSSRHS